MSGENTLTSPTPPSEVSAPERHPIYDDPQVQLVSSLRSQITDLMHQVTQLNGKLVQSYDRVSDLEDGLHVTSSNLRSSTLQISQLEIERAQHLAALNTGLLVEKGSITAELTRLMERVSEETMQRGRAEDAKVAIEKDLDDLSATLFAQANTMVAEARYARAVSERKAEDSEKALKGAEEAVSMLQIQMQTLREEKEQSESERDTLRLICGLSGRTTKSPLNAADSAISLPRLSTTHPSYHEFLVFISHVRSLKPNGGQIPQMSTLIGLPFLSRLIAEDSEPTLRLEAAPALNWLTRRNVQTAIYSGQLTVEPMSTHRLQTDPTVISSVTALRSLHDLTCSICGKYIYPNPSMPTRSKSSRLVHQASASLVGTSRFLKQQLSSSPSTQSPPSPLLSSIPPQTFVFRLSVPQSQTTSYPLCHHGYCLVRLRSTCDLWHFVRKNVVEYIWNEPEGLKRAVSWRAPSPNELHSRPWQPTDATPQQTVLARRNVASRVGDLWGKGLGALGFDKAPSRGSTPPPISDVNLHNAEPERRRVPPPPSALSTQRTASASETLLSKPSPPPLPPRGQSANDVLKSPDQASSQERSDNTEVMPFEEEAIIHEETDPPEAPRVRQDEADSAYRNGSPDPDTAPQTPITDGFTTPPEINRALPPGSSPEAPKFTADASTSNTEQPSDHATTRDDVDPGITKPVGQADEPGVPERERPATPTPPNPEKSSLGSPIKAGGTPPPLPRRAAARERPISIVKTPEPPALPSRTGSPIPQPHVPPASEGKISPDIPSRRISQLEHASPTEMHPTSTDTPANGNTENSRASTPVLTNPVHVEVESETNDVPIDPIPAPVPPKLPLRPVNGNSVPVTSDTMGEVDVPVLPHNEEDTGPSVGDQTWEDRQWKELVRLREAMFWARVGGHRSVISS